MGILKFSGMGKFFKAIDNSIDGGNGKPGKYARFSRCAASSRMASACDPTA